MVNTCWKVPLSPACASLLQAEMSKTWSWKDDKVLKNDGHCRVHEERRTILDLNWEPPRALHNKQFTPYRCIKENNGHLQDSIQLISLQNIFCSDNQRKHQSRSVCQLTGHLGSAGHEGPYKTCKPLQDQQDSRWILSIIKKKIFF